jgi:hypothetical protein
MLMLPPGPDGDRLTQTVMLARDPLAALRDAPTPAAIAAIEPEIAALAARHVAAWPTSRWPRCGA